MKNTLNKYQNNFEKPLKPIIDTKQSESFDLSSHRNQCIERGCCGLTKIVDHSKPFWTPNFIWERNEYLIFGKKKQFTSRDLLQIKKIKKLRSQ